MLRGLHKPTGWCSSICNFQVEAHPHMVDISRIPMERVEGQEVS